MLPDIAVLFIILHFGHSLGGKTFNLRQKSMSSEKISKPEPHIVHMREPGFASFKTFPITASNFGVLSFIQKFPRYPFLKSVHRFWKRSLHINVELLRENED